MRALWITSIAIMLSGCATKDVFKPKSAYPPDPWVKGYSNPDDCLGGEKLAARNFELPKYPRRSFNSGRQGWVIMRLDVNAKGFTENIDVERSVPDGLFEGVSRNAIKNWTFQPPKDGGLKGRGCDTWRLGLRSLIAVKSYLKHR